MMEVTEAEQERDENKADEVSMWTLKILGALKWIGEFIEKRSTYHCLVTFSVGGAWAGDMPGENI